MTNKDILPLFNEQDQSLPDERLKFSSGWINPAKFKRLMDSGPIPVGRAGLNAYKTFSNVLEGDGVIEDFPFHLEARDNGPEFDGRITVLRVFEWNGQVWWVGVPGSNGRPLYNISLYCLSKQNLASETWQVYTRWLDEQKRDKEVETLSDFNF